jgi:hypothetical protein
MLHGTLCKHTCLKIFPFQYHPARSLAQQPPLLEQDYAIGMILPSKLMECCSTSLTPRSLRRHELSPGPNRWCGSGVSRIKISYAMAYVAQGEESYVTLRIGFELRWASSH